MIEKILVSWTAEGMEYRIGPGAGRVLSERRKKAPFFPSGDVSVGRAGGFDWAGLTGWWTSINSH